MGDKMLIERDSSNPLFAVIDVTPIPAERGEHGSLRIRLLGITDHHTGPSTILVAPSECEQLIEIAKTVMANATAEKLRQSDETAKFGLPQGVPPAFPPAGPFPGFNGNAPLQSPPVPPPLVPMLGPPAGRSR
jgi:hypothetical protein